MRVWMDGMARHAVYMAAIDVRLIAAVQWTCAAGGKRMGDKRVGGLGPDLQVKSWFSRPLHWWLQLLTDACINLGRWSSVSQTQIPIVSLLPNARRRGSMYRLSLCTRLNAVSLTNSSFIET